MARLLDKLVILMICAIGLCSDNSWERPVVVLLISAALTLFSQLWDNVKVSTILVVVWAVSCIFFPIMICTLPLILFEALSLRRPWLIVPAFAALGRADELTMVQFVITAVGSLCAWIIYSRISRLEAEVDKLHALRDTTAESNIQLSMENHQLAEAQDNEIRLATLRERNRIAREIHDNVGHMLTRSLLQSGALLVINKDEAMREPLESLRDTLDSAMTSIRASVHDLHDESVDLHKIIDDCIASVDSRFRVELDYDAGDTIPADIRLCFAGVIKEGINNAVKHSTGDRIRITVREHPGLYQLVVADNGSCTEIHETGIGLKNMRERAASVGGHITFTPSREGFRIFMSVQRKDKERNK